MNIPNGKMVWWRFMVQCPCPWRFGYSTIISGDLVRMGAYNGDVTGGVVVSQSEIEWRKHD